MVNRDEAIAAARIRPGLRTPEQQRAYESDKDNQAVKNANAAAERDQKIYGKK